MYADAQILNMVVGNVTYAFPASEAGVMNYQGCETLTVMGKTFRVADVAKMYVDDHEVTDNSVTVNYNGSVATMTVAGNVAQYVTPTIDGAHVSLVQSDAVSDDVCGEITYVLAGTSTDGEFSLEGSYKATVELNGLSLTNAAGAPLNIQDGKRIALSVKKGTENTLTDGVSGAQKGCIVCKGHLEMKGKGTLNVYGNTAHGIYSKEYVELKNCTVNVLAAAKDGINCNQYFLMESGTLSISGTADDGVQVSYKDATDRETEDTGTLTVNGGTLNISVTGTATKGLKADGDVVITDGELNLTTSGGGKWDADDVKTKACSCISADGHVRIDGGTLTLVSSGSGGKGISCDSTLTINGGTISVTTTGNGAEGIESKAVLTVNDGTLVVNSYDDGLNSSSHMYIKGGDITVVASGNDGIDSNGNLYISGGVIRAFGTSAPECGIDVNEEDGYSVIFTGGTLLAVGGGNSVPSTAASTQPYVTGSMSVTANSTVTLKSGSTVLATFTVPSNYTSSGQGGGGFGGRAFGGPGGQGGPGGGSMSGSSVLVSCAGLASGSSYTLTSGSSSSTVTAQLKGSGNGNRP